MVESRYDAWKKRRETRILEALNALEQQGKPEAPPLTIVTKITELHPPRTRLGRALAPTGLGTYYPAFARLEQKGEITSQRDKTLGRRTYKRAT